jgi:hypothetical protein
MIVPGFQSEEKQPIRDTHHGVYEYPPHESKHSPSHKEPPPTHHMLRHVPHLDEHEGIINTNYYPPKDLLEGEFLLDM